MAVVQGVKEKIHSPLYDAIAVEPEKQLRSVESSNTLKFFVNVQGKTKLETNLQASSVLSHYNTYEARAMRVVISDLRPEFPDDPTISSDEVADFELFVTDADDEPICILPATGAVVTCGTTDSVEVGAAVIELGLFSLVELLKEANDSDGFAEIPVDDDAVTSVQDANGNELSAAAIDNVINEGGVIFISAFELEILIEELDRDSAPREQFVPNNGAGTLISKLLYNTVTTLFVGEKTMIEAPTWMFPAGAGPFSDQASITTNGIPSPMDTFRFAEPIFIDKQQNFRVEIEIPDADVLKETQKLYGPFFIWVVLDGYMTRDVQ